MPTKKHAPQLDGHRLPVQARVQNGLKEGLGVRRRQDLLDLDGQVIASLVPHLRRPHHGSLDSSGPGQRHARVEHIQQGGVVGLEREQGVHRSLQREFFAPTIEISLLP